MVKIPAGEFMMGSEKYDAEKPVHKVTVGEFYLDKYEVTNAQWKKFVGTNPKWQKGRIDRQYHDGDYLDHWQGPSYPSDQANHPVVYVSWHAARAYAEWVGGRLPTEAEWEYACRAGSQTEYCFGDDARGLGEYAWYDENSGGSTHPVGEKRASAFGLHDMHGNVWEWCQSLYKPYPYQYNDGREDLGILAKARVLRGGSWINRDLVCRSAHRLTNYPDLCFDFFGFRVVVPVR